MNNNFRYYMHDGPNAFSLELSGTMSDHDIVGLEQARRTASSTMGSRSFIVDLSYVDGVQPAGRAMLRRWYDEGAQLVAKLPGARVIVGLITGQAPELIAKSARRQTWRPFLAAALATLALTTLFAPARTVAANLQPAAVPAWHEYVRTADARNQRHLMAGNARPKVDITPCQGTRLCEGRLL